MEYNLHLTIEQSDLENMKLAGMNITLAKPVGKSSPNVTWQVFDPWQSNDVTWEENYGIYASPLQIYKSGAIITRLSGLEPPVQDGKTYKFQKSNTFKQIEDPEPPSTGTYKILNDSDEVAYPILTFGLTQGAIIHGKPSDNKFLNAALVMAHNQVLFTPITTVYVWLQAEFISGTVITSISAKATKVEYSGTSNTQSLIYDRSKGMFVKDSNEKTDNKVELIFPRGIHRVER